MMRKAPPAANPDAYVAQLSGWQRKSVELLRSNVLAAADLDEVVKWGHLVYLSNGPVLLIRAEDDRVLFGFWRGKQLTSIEKRLKPGGKYDMATAELKEDSLIDATTVGKLVRKAVAMNKELGNPTAVASKQKPKSAREKRARR